MNDTSYRPSQAAAIALRRDGQRWMLVFTRELRHSPERVWEALTDPAELSQWAPFDADRNLERLGSASLTMADAGGTPGETLAAVVRASERPRLLEYTWGDDVLRWELQPIAGGTRLTLQHTMDDREWVPKTAAGWHICLDVAERLMSGRPVGRIVSSDAMQHGWNELHDMYAGQQGILE